MQDVQGKPAHRRRSSSCRGDWIMPAQPHKRRKITANLPVTRPQAALTFRRCETCRPDWPPLRWPPACTPSRAATAHWYCASSVGLRHSGWWRLSPLALLALVLPVQGPRQLCTLWCRCRACRPSLSTSEAVRHQHVDMPGLARFIELCSPGLCWPLIRWCSARVRQATELPFEVRVREPVQVMSPRLIRQPNHAPVTTEPATEVDYLSILSAAACTSCHHTALLVREVGS
jgi:hypothetical protein